MKNSLKTIIIAVTLISSANSFGTSLKTFKEKVLEIKAKYLNDSLNEAGVQGAIDHELSRVDQGIKKSAMSFLSLDQFKRDALRLKKEVEEGTLTNAEAHKKAHFGQLIIRNYGAAKTQTDKAAAMDIIDADFPA